MRRPAIAAVVVVALLGLTVGISEGLDSSARSTGAPAPAARTLPVAASRLVCPDVVDRTVGRVVRTTRVGVAAPATAPVRLPRAGRVEATVVGSKAAPAKVLDQRGTVAVRNGARTAGDVMLAGGGALAPGLTANEVGRRDAGPYRGIDGVACARPGGEAWLLGASTVVGAHAELLLTNIDDVPAVVDINLSGRKGAVEAPDGLGVSVRAHRTKAIRLESIAPGEAAMLVHVVVRSGRVAVALRQQLQRASTPQGLDWIPQAQPPARRSVVAGLAAGPGPREVLLANPGDLDATASVRVVLGDSSFVPRGLSELTVPAGRTRTIDITKVTGERSAGIAVTADRPVVAGARMSTGPRVSGYAEQAWSAASPPLTGPSVIALNDVSGRSSLLLLTAPARAADVTVAALGSAGGATGRSKTVHVRAGRTVQVDLAGLAGDAFSIGVSVTPQRTGGQVYAARELVEMGSHGPLYSVLPIWTATQVVRVRPARADLHVGLPR